MAEFYLYFDDNGQILSVSGGKDATSTSRYAVFPEEEVIGFMNGNLSPANYQIIENFLVSCKKRHNICKKLSSHRMLV